VKDVGEFVAGAAAAGSALVAGGIALGVLGSALVLLLPVCLPVVVLTGVTVTLACKLTAASEFTHEPS